MELLTHLFLREDTYSFHLMKNWIMSSVHLVTPVDVSTHQELVVPLPHELSLVCTGVASEDPFGVDIICVWRLPAHMIFRYQQLVEILLHSYDRGQIIEHLERRLPEGFRILLKVEFNPATHSQRRKESERIRLYDIYGSVLFRGDATNCMVPGIMQFVRLTWLRSERLHYRETLHWCYVRKLQVFYNTIWAI